MSQLSRRSSPDDAGPNRISETIGRFSQAVLLVLLIADLNAGLGDENKSVLRENRIIGAGESRKGRADRVRVTRGPTCRVHLNTSAYLSGKFFALDNPARTPAEHSVGQDALVFCRSPDPSSRTESPLISAPELLPENPENWTLFPGFVSSPNHSLASVRYHIYAAVAGNSPHTVNTATRLKCLFFQLQSIQTTKRITFCRFTVETSKARERAKLLCSHNRFLSFGSFGYHGYSAYPTNWRSPRKKRRDKFAKVLSG
ncbi:unnamed protein product [Nesidiocoris tenuis]|uniref:Uncharacterized protein n=1 Tax=Nesidiocoris tenuis TaxID=355587 RepID=A0A6H5H5H7_9HEMI|nr:unnamed protein product [Nesidiocoris tenuis]